MITCERRRITHLEWPRSDRICASYRVEAGDGSPRFTIHAGQGDCLGRDASAAATCCSRALASSRSWGGDQSRPAQEHPRERGISARCRGHRFLAVRHGELASASGTPHRDYLIAGLWYAAGATHADSLWSTPPAGARRPPSPGAVRGCRVRIETCAAASAPGTYRGRVAGPDRSCASCAGTDRARGEIEDASNGRRSSSATELELFSRGGTCPMRAARTEDALQAARKRIRARWTPLPGPWWRCT